MARGVIGMSDELVLAVIRTAFPSATIITEPPEETLLNSNTHACPAAPAPSGFPATCSCARPTGARCPRLYSVRGRRLAGRRR